MRWKLSFFQIFIILTFLIALAAFIGAALAYINREPTPVRIETTGQPTVGDAAAKVHVIVFEDFRCATCQEFAIEMFPKIQERYIATGQVRYTLIPLAFMEGSKPIGNAALAVYQIAPDRFIAYAHELFEYFSQYSAEEREKTVLLELAGKIGGIDLMELKTAIETNRFYNELDQNFHLALEIMGHQFGTPALFINGLRTSPASFERIQNRIEQAIIKTQGGKR